MTYPKYGFSTNVGNVRSHNEDSLRIEPELGLWVVADGMGGHQGGETASALAADFIVEQIRAGYPMEESIAQAHHAIKQASREGKGPEGMGTTVVVLRIIADTCEIAWVGDCRAYAWDGKVLKQLTKDHSYVQHLVDTGVILPSESANHPYQDVLVQALGAGDINDVTVDKITHTLHQEEQILLCSDGLTKEVDNWGIAAALALELDEQEKVDYLVRAALANGGRDNITIALISAGDDAPVKMTAGDTVPMNNEELKPAGLWARLRSRLNQMIKRLF